MAKWPYRKSKEELAALPSSLLDFQHFCIDDDPLAQFMLLNQLKIHRILPEELEENIYGYRGVKQKENASSLIYIFLTEEEHLEIQKIVQTVSEPCTVTPDGKETSSNS